MVRDRFVDLAAWDACVQPALVPVVQDKSLAVWVGVDASTKRDSTALVAVAYDGEPNVCSLVAHKVFTPTPGDPIDVESTIEATLREWRERFPSASFVWLDRTRWQSPAQRLARSGYRLRNIRRRSRT